jgi:DinB superfamily
MNDEPIQNEINQLSATPALLRNLLSAMDPMKLRTKPAPGLFSPLEDAWHLRDIEMEGYIVRIQRMLTEQSPVLVDLNGDQMAIERRYNELELAPAVEDFANARAESISLLTGLAPDAWTRPAQFANRKINLQELIEMMVEHDRGHISSIQGVFVASVAA